MILGIIGEDTKNFIKILEKNKRFQTISLKKSIQEDLIKNNKKPTKKKTDELVEKLRKISSKQILAERILKEIKKEQKIIITDIELEEELTFLNTLENFTSICVGVESSLKKKAKIIVRKTKNYEEKIEKILNDLHKRPDWDEYFFEIMKAVSLRATCNRGRSGAVIVRDKTILSTGYVGAPRGLPHCDEVGHLMMKAEYDYGKKEHCIRTTHAEQNTIVQAANSGTSLKDSTLYCYMEPCIHCTKMIINAGIKRVVCRKKYQAANHSRLMLEQAGVRLDVREDVVEDYK